jgi:energy-coupling factor transporter ATP-binding protein EcfA2
MFPFPPRDLDPPPLKEVEVFQPETQEAEAEPDMGFGLGLDGEKLEYDGFKTTMFIKGPLLRVQDRLNMRQPLTSNIYRETSKGLKLLNNFHNECLDILELNGITKYSAQKQYIERLARDITIEDELNKDAEYLIATPSGEVIDLKALSQIKKEGKKPEEYSEDWRKHISMFQDNRITLRTGIDYNPAISPEVGVNIIGRLVQLMVSSPNENVFYDTKQWLIGFMGRLLIGGNIWKEFVTLLGEKDSGKTTFVSILKTIMGSYCGIVQDEVLQSTDSVSVNRSLYSLKDKRLLIHSEGTNQRKINTVTLKRITGDSYIPLGNQDYSFTIQGKIIEDTNYAPVPDNPTDEAFNERGIIIPFQKNTVASKTYIEETIKYAKENVEAIFVAMVYAATDSIGAVKKSKPWISVYVSQCLSILRNLEKVFYEKICNVMVTDNVKVLGTLVHSTFQDWVRECIVPALRNMPYLASEKIEYPSGTEFHAKMRKLHPYYVSHSREGLMYRRLFLQKDKIYWGSMLVWKENDPIFQSKRNEALITEQNRKMQETFNRKEVLEGELESSISKDRDIIQGINRNKSKRGRETHGPTMAPLPLLGMGIGGPNSWSPPMYSPNPYLNNFIPPIQSPPPPNPSGPIITPKKSESTEDKSTATPPVPSPKEPEKEVGDESSPTSPITEVTQEAGKEPVEDATLPRMISEEDYNAILKELSHDPRYFRCIDLDKLANDPEGTRYGCKLIYTPFGIEFIDDKDVKDYYPED